VVCIIQLANTGTERASLASADFRRLEFLHEQVWAKKDALPDGVFRNFEFPMFKNKTDTDTDTDTNPPERREIWTAEKLSLLHISNEPTLQGIGRLPCRADELLVRESYREMYDILVTDQEDRIRTVHAGRMIPDWKKFSLILGQPGIGKRWFLSYVLVRRLLEGKPTIFQAGICGSDAAEPTAATHYLINANGVHPMRDSPSISVLTDPEIWFLADHHPVGAAVQASHNWLVVVTSSTRKRNNHYLIKNWSPRKYYLPVREWEEIVAAAKSYLPVSPQALFSRLNWLPQFIC